MEYLSRAEGLARSFPGLPTPRSLAEEASACGLRIVEVQVSRSGRAAGARRILQALAEGGGRAGHALFGARWPLAVAHVFVLERGGKRA